MRELGLSGLVAVLFGLGGYYATGHMAAFSLLNLGAGSAALLLSLAASARGLRHAGGPAARRVIGFGLLRIAAALALGALAVAAADRARIHLDWTLEQQFVLSPATKDRFAALAARPAGDDLAVATLYYDPEDPRLRRTRLLLQTLEGAAGGHLELRERVLANHPDEADRYAVGSSNTVVLALGQRWERIERPSVGTFYEALYRLTGQAGGTIVVLRGEGEGDVERDDELGYSGLGAALVTEGYQLREKVSAALEEVPEGTTAVLVIAPERRLLPTALAALRRYLGGGGRLLALLEPGRETGIEDLLAEYGIASPDALVVDPASAPIDVGLARGVGIIAYNYEVAPATRGLDRDRMTFFPGARPLELTRPRPGDDVRRIVMSSPRGFTTRDLSWLDRRSGAPPQAGSATDYETLGATGRYARGGGETRIAVFGDSGFASNRFLRALYNQDLVLNAMHWTAQREPSITLRPKIPRTVQFPLPLTNTAQALYGVGLLLPELLMIAAGVVWLRRRAG
jgi:hypothetical protein